MSIVFDNIQKKISILKKYIPENTAVYISRDNKKKLNENEINFIFIEDNVMGFGINPNIVSNEDILKLQQLYFHLSKDYFYVYFV